MLYRNRIITALIMLTLILSMGVSQAKSVDSFDANRARMLGILVKKNLSLEHYSDKDFNDDLSHIAFDLYLKQLDFQKRFLLSEDVDMLEKYRSTIDDGIGNERLELALQGRVLLNQRIEQVRGMVEELIKEPIDIERNESLETDAEKTDFVDNAVALRERWRKIIKFQVLSRYLNLREDEIGTDDKGGLLAVTEEQQGDLLKQAQEKVAKANKNLFKRMLDESRQDHYDRYLNAVARAFDPHTSYLAPMTQEDFEIQMSGSLEGIGATLREEDGYIKVVRVVPGSAASRQGQLEADDIILQVAQGADEPVDVTDTRLRDAVSLIRGKKGTEVRLSVKKPDGRRIVIPIIRDVVEIEEAFVKSTIVTDEKSNRNFGYIRIPSFYRDYSGKTNRNCTDDLRAELRKLKAANISGLILDLRNNGGGSLSDAVTTTGLFIETGPVVQIRDRRGQKRVLRDRDSRVEYDGPMIVLVNRFSASASEILAGALQDYGRALIVGDVHTHGKGTVQALFDLDRKESGWGMQKYMPLGALKVTIQKFYRISGESTQEKGVTPDIILPSRLDGLESGEQYLDNALPWDHIDAVPYQSWNNYNGKVKELRRLSEQRVEGDEDFEEIVETAELANKRREESMQSLRLSRMIEQRQEAQQLSHEMSFDAEDGEDDDEDKERTLDETIADDPYVDEGVLLLQDYLRLAS